jgi:hypothetical protein
MADVILGTVASVITIWDVVKEIRDFSARFKNAPKDWKKYCDGLESLAHVCQLLCKLVHFLTNK